MSNVLNTGFSDEQALALNLERHIIVSAAAGSGKTRMLVERYVRTLLTGVLPREIVAITFTRKAAAEMLTRIRGRIDELLSQGDVLSQEERTTLVSARAGLSQHRVSTIHSFCSELLREYAIEAGVPPAFSELGRSAAQQMMETAIDTAVQRRWKNKTTSSGIQSLFFGIDTAEIRQTLTTLAGDALKLQRVKKLYSLSDTDILRNVSEEYFETLCVWQVDEMRHILNLIPLVCAGTIPDVYQEWFKGVSTVFDEFVQHAQRENVSHRFVYDMTERIRSLPKKPRKSTKTGFDAAHVLMDRIEDIRKEIAKIPSGAYEADLRMLAHARTLVDVAIEVVDELDRRKREIQQLDFEDLQRIALQILSDPMICNEVRRSIRCIMIDEFQDTNDVQFDLLKKIVPEGNPDKKETRISVFLVGDVKQSIYGFRDADVRVFARAEEYIQTLNKNHFGVTGEGCVHLSASYRMSVDVATVVNAICQDVFAGSSSEYDVVYEPLVCARDEATAVKGSNEILFGNGATRSPEDDDEPVRQHQLVADAVRRIVDEQQVSVYDKSVRAVRPARYSDIAVLSRTAKSLASLETEFLISGIPYLRHAGSGFYATQEVQDALSLLRFFLDPTDSAALVAVLRSPMFAVPDSEILANARIRDGHDLWVTLRTRYLNLNASFRDSRMLFAVTTLSEFADKARMIAPSDILRDILLRTGWYARIEYLQHRTEQARNNIEKLMSELQGVESAGLRHLHEVVQELQLRTLLESREGEAAVLTDDNVVNLMTVHASKGLEFPIVILYDLGAKSRNHSRQCIIHDSLGLCFPLSKKQPDLQTGAMRFFAEKWLKARENAEMKRVLYVAMTRAKDHLLLACNSANSSGKELFPTSGMCALINGSLALPCLRGSDFELSITQGIRNNEGSVVEEMRTARIHTRRVITSDAIVCGHELHSSPVVNSTDTILFDVRPIPATSRGEIYSATQLMLYCADRWMYYRRYHLGYMPDAEYDHDDSFLGTSEELSAAEVGTIVHEVLAEVQRWWHEDIEFEMKRRAEVINEVCRRKDIQGSEDLKERVETHCNNAAAVMRKHGVRPENIERTEYSLTTPIGDDFCTGKMDAVVRMGGLADGMDRLEVWDWKTNDLEQRLPDELVKKYSVQLRLYCFLLLRSNPNAQRCAARLVFTSTGDERVIEMNRREEDETEQWLLELIASMKKL